MKVTKISAELQYSRTVHNGNGWKKVNLGAEATIAAKEDWREAQKALYGQLAGQLKELFTNGPQAPSEKPAEPDNPGKPEETRMCPIHNVPMTRRTNENGGSWYSHNDETTRGKWCQGKTK